MKFVLHLRLCALLTVVVAAPAGASDNWFCSEASSQRVGNEIQACGTGISPDESEARLRAFDNAKEEFERICEASADCQGHRAIADPRRTTCETEQSVFHCRRLVAFTIESAPGDAEATASAASGSVPIRKPASVQLPKIEKGLSKSEVLSRFGDPVSAQEVDARNLILYYRNPSFCTGAPCTVVLFDNHVDHYFGFSMSNTYALDNESFWGKLKFW